MVYQDNPKYYEKYDWDAQDFNDSLENKIRRIFSIIPADVKSIIDIGCGNGAITNRLSEKYSVAGIDRSKNALQYVRVNKLLASSDHLAVRNQTFDLVLCSEVVEHLEPEVFEQTLQELKRVTKKYLLVTFPNRETIEKDFVRCPECQHVFNKSYHLRLLDEHKFVRKFPEFRLVKCFEFGKGKRGYHKILTKIKHTFVSSDAWIPPRWTPGSSRKVMCPKCEKEFIIPYHFSLLGFLCDAMNSVLSPFKPYWLFILMERKES